MKKEIDEKENLEIMRRCPRWNECSVPKCPLDHYQSQRVKLEGEPRCTLAKSIRMRIAKGTQLKYQGMTKSEWIGKKNWEAKPEVEKQMIIKRGKIQFAKLKHNAMGIPRGAGR